MTVRGRAMSMDRVAELLAVRAGLDFSGGRGRWLRHFLDRAQLEDAHGHRRLGQDPDAFARLCDAATVQESYFFREPAALRLVRDEVLPELARDPGLVRVWSAGCAAGEEAYTLAMMLFDAGLGARGRVLGTDISPAAIEAARSRTYSKWSLRGVDEGTVHARFRPQGTAFEIATERCAKTSFEWHNLLSDSPPSGGPFHLVLCRNVLIYLTPAAVRHVGDLLAGALAPGGWLVTGVSDPSLAGVAGLEPVDGSQGSVYRRIATAAGVTATAQDARGADDVGAARRPAAAPPRVSVPRSRAARSASPHGLPAPPETHPSGTGHRPSRPTALPVDWEARAELALLRAEPRECERLARAALTTSGDLGAAHSLLVRALACEGRSGEAMAAVRKAVARNGNDSELRSLQAVLLLDEQRWDEARVIARQAIYLDRDNALAHLVLSRAADHLGDESTAQRSGRNGRRSIARREGHR